MSTELIKIEKEISPIQEKANSLQIIDTTTLNEASSYLIFAKKNLKALKEDMNTLLDPLKESAKAIKAKYEPAQEALGLLIDTLTKKTVTYQTKLVNERLEAELAISQRVKDGKGNLSVESATKRIENLEIVEKKVETDVGGMSFVPYPMCEVEDITQVPIKYYLVDMVAVRAEMKAGNKLPGIRYWTEQRPRNSR